MNVYPKSRLNTLSDHSSLRPDSTSRFHLKTINWLFLGFLTVIIVVVVVVVVMFFRFVDCVSLALTSPCHQMNRHVACDAANEAPDLMFFYYLGNGRRNKANIAETKLRPL